MLNRCVLRWCLKVLMLGIEQISCGRAFHSFGAATWNDLLPKVALVRKDGSSSGRPLEDDLNLYLTMILPNKNHFQCDEHAVN